MTNGAAREMGPIMQEIKIVTDDLVRDAERVKQHVKDLFGLDMTDLIKVPPGNAPMPPMPVLREHVHRLHSVHQLFAQILTVLDTHNGKEEPTAMPR